ncbi:MAG: HAD hydrolase family protein [Candidatus Omnitrophica bacterium]|nr:HAD hydrolase family protein [Candidatus Omnitrophota bacterium]
MRKSNIRVIFYDFDGVMTDNRVLLFENDKEAVFVNRSDGHAIKMIKEMGILQVIISTENSPLVRLRGRKLGIPVIHSANDKKEIVGAYLKKRGISKECAVFIGNDINDKEAMMHVGWPIAPADSQEEIKNIARIILKTKGGFGAIREFLGLLEGIYNV